MGKNINVRLALEDKMSKPLDKTTAGTKRLERQIKIAHNTISKFAQKASDAFKKVAKVGAVGIGAGGIAAAGVGFKEAFDLEGYRLQLETATKDTKKAADIMSYAMSLANKTPFEGGQLVEGATKFEAMGMSAKKWLPLVGDMAAATNKDFDQAIEALIDAQSGELERLKEFGIKKADIVSKANEMFSGAQVVANNGQITDQAKFNDAMVALMESKFTGGMEKQAGTVKGLWSTVTGVFKSSMANIVGITEEGTVKSGSAMDFLKDKIKGVSEKFTQWQSDGTIDAIAVKITDVLSVAFRIFGGAIGFVKNNINWILPVMAGLVGAFVAFNVITAVVSGFSAFQKIVKGVTAAQGILNFVMAANPIALVAIAIGILVAAGVALWKNWDTIKVKAQELYDKIQPVFAAIGDFIGGIFSGVKEKVGAVFDWFSEKIQWVKDKIGWLGKKVESIPIIGGAVKWIKGKTSGHATGTPYFAGGQTRINEGGRGENVVLPNGTQIIPHELSKKRGGLTVNLEIVVQGNIIGDTQYADYLGSIITRKLTKALGNV